MQGSVAPPALISPRGIAQSLSVEPGEETRTALLFLLFFLASMVFVMGRTARDALFLTQFPVNWIAYMWVAYGVVSSGAALAYGWISPRVSRERLTIVFSLAAALSYLAVRVAVESELGWAIAFFYVWAEVIANLFVIQAWAITNDLHNPRSARRLFGLIGAGRILGMLLSGFVTGALVRALGTPNLIVVVAGTMVLFAVLVRVIAKRHKLPKATINRSVKIKPVALDARRTTDNTHRRYAILLSVMLLVIFIALTVGDYQFKAIAKLTYSNRDDLASYMAGFYAAMGALAFVFQVFITPRILKHLGVVAALLTMPLAFLSSTAVLLGAPILPVATMMKLSDNGLQYTIHDATIQLLYFAFPSKTRTRVRAILDAMVKPLGYSLGGVVLVLLSPIPLPGETAASLSGRIAHVGLISLALGVLWVGVVPFVRRAYVASLQRSLARRQSDPTEETELTVDSSLRKVLLDTIRTGMPGQVVFAVERLAASDPEAAAEQLPSMTNHESPLVRAHALHLAQQLGIPGASGLARALLADPDADVRSAALETLGVILGEDAVDEVEHFVDDDAHPRLRDTAIVTLIRHGGLPGVLVGGARLQLMLKSPDAGMRAAAAGILGAVGQRSLARTLRPLLRDPSVAVRRSAAIAAQGNSASSLTTDLLAALPERRLTKPVVRALISLGPTAIPDLVHNLEDVTTPRIARLNLPRVLHGIGTPEALVALRNNFDDLDEGVRQKVLASASRLREALSASALSTSALLPLIEQEIAEHTALRDGFLRIRPWLARPLLDAHMRAELRGHIVRIMRLCEQAYPREHVSAARRGIFSSDASKRANALEVLDNVLDRSKRMAILELVDRYACDCDFRRSPTTPGEPVPAEAAAWFRERIALPGHFRRSLLFEAVGYHRLTALAKIAEGFVTKPNPFMRENALIALAGGRPEGWRKHLERAVDDEEPTVSAYARYVLETGSAGLDPEDSMYTTVEKILFLQGVPMFATIPANELMPLAMSSTVLQMPSGHVLFREGDCDGSLFVVVHGRVTLRKGDTEVGALGPGEVVGELALLDDAPRPISATASEDSDVMRVSADSFRDAIQDNAEFANAVINVLATRLRDLMDRELIVNTDVEGRKTVC